MSEFINIDDSGSYKNVEHKFFMKKFGKITGEKIKVFGKHFFFL